MHSMVFTNVGIDKFDKWLKYAYLPLLKARIACPSSAKFGTRIAILDFSAIHQYSRYGTKPFAPIINECQCAMRMLIQTLHLCIQAFIDGFHGTTEAEVSQTRFAVTYISMFLLYVSRAKPRTIERMMYCTLEFRLAQTGTLVSDFVLAMNMLLEAKIAENGTSTESMDGLLMEGLPEDLALQGIRWIKPFCQIDSDISEDALHEGRRQLRLLALAKEVVGAKAIFVSYCAEARGFEIAETLLRQAMAQQEASVAASKKSLESTKRHMPSTGPFSGIAHDCTFVFDTNCFIRGLDEIKEMMSLGWSVVVPVAVLTELRGLMNRKNYELCMSAKDAAQFITSTHRDFGGYGPLQVYTRKGQRVFNLKAKPEINPRGNTMDDTIVETCRSFTPNAALVTNDRNMRIKAAMVYGQDIRIGDLKDIQTYIYPSQ
ncbi:hypothetical protein FBU59_002203 [Linderina macrospora]|uniref:Uncharacterized protein n=1 Tax=Linderina macrospora TaxID=4868 RepID=A0ACC1JBP4_9FUNG|nr:hypothetical protein FBU59_002203 [Linderina macrospora]